MLFSVMLSSACHRTAVVPAPDCGAQPYGTAGVEFAAANTMQMPSAARHGEQLVVRVREGTSARHPVSDASVALFASGGGADSGQFATGRTTGADGEARLDSLAPRRYEVFVRRIGYAPLRERVTVRAGFVDTLAISLQGVPVCLIE